ncbi:MAG: CehA/McbA family metallohydrolase [Candidatus Limnocylindrales bacterium]
MQESRGAASIRLEGRLTRADRERDPYAYPAFEVPAGIAAIRISLDHEPRGSADDPGRGAVLDLGLIGPGSLKFGAPSFRGWSGSERRSVIIGATRATPGYRPGPIEAGTWHVILGLYAIPPGGCTYRLDIDLLSAEPARAEPAAAGVTPERQSGADRWIPCDLHAHTVHSDGADDIATVAGLAVQAGLEVLFVTDHNTDSHHPELVVAGRAAGIELLPGEEVTTYGGHFNALGIDAWVDFRHASPGQVRRAIDAIHAQAGLASINHPASTGSPWTHGPDLPFDLVEVWNGPWRDENERALAWWTELIETGRRVTAVGGSDMHSSARRDQPVGTPLTWVRAVGTGRAAIVEGLRAGRVIVARDRSIGLPRLSVVDAAGTSHEVGSSVELGGPLEVRWEAAGHADHELRLLSRLGSIQIVELAPDRLAGSLRLDPAERAAAGYVRLELRAAGELLALTNPIYLEAI